MSATTIFTETHSAGRYRAFEPLSTVQLGFVIKVHGGWYSTLLQGKHSVRVSSRLTGYLCSFATLAAARMELGRYFDDHCEDLVGELQAKRRAQLAATL